MLLSLRINGLTSLNKEVRVFKVSETVFGPFPRFRCSLHCPSFPWSFRKYQGKPQKRQGFPHLANPSNNGKQAENTQKHQGTYKWAGDAHTNVSNRFARIDSQKKTSIFEALGQIRANRVFPPIQIQIRVIRGRSSLLSIF